MKTGVLVAAADAGWREAAVQLLSRRGWSEVVGVGSAAEGVRVLLGGSVGCAVVESRLADVSGVQGIPILRAVDGSVRIVFSAPAGNAELEAQVRALDVFYYHLESDGTADLAAAVEAAIGPPRGRTAGPVEVLVIDDDPFFRELLRVMLEAEGFRVTGAGSGDEGLALARARRPALIVLDIMMETATEGLRLVHEIRKDAELRHTPLVAVSAVSQRSGIALPWSGEDELTCADAYFSKPVDAGEFVAGLHRLLGRGG